MIWRFSDGTTVELGGNVDGASLFAQRLRVELAQTKHVCIWAPPSPPVAFDAGDPALLNRVLEDALNLARRLDGLKLTMVPPADVPPLPPPPWAGRESEHEHTEGQVY